jgi:hypothetical protein
MEVVVFPTPPFWFAMAMTFTRRKDGRKSAFSNAKLSGRKTEVSISGKIPKPVEFFNHGCHGFSRIKTNSDD